MKSQGWLSQEGSVLQLLCADPCCHISNDMALDIQRLLTGKNTLITPTSAGISPRSACLEILFMSGVSKQNLQLGSKNSRELLLASVTSTLLQSAAQKSLTQMAALSTVVVSIQDYWDEHLQLGKGFQRPDVPRDSGTRSSSRLDETEVSVNKQEMIYSNHSLFHENQSLQPLRSQVSLLFLSTEVTNLTHAMALHMVTIFPAHLPFLSPEVLRLLEVHVKKWMHFQRWGLPRCVEESLRQLMPDSPFFYWPGNSQPVPFIMYDTFNACVVTIETISHKTWGSCVLYQTTQAFWVTKWSIMDQEQSCHCQKTPNSLALALPSPALKVLNGLHPQPGGQAEDSGNHLKQKHSQLFCSFSCLTTESLAVTYIHFQGLSTNRCTPQLPSNVPFLFKGPSFLHLLPNNPPRSTPLSSLPTPNWVSPPDHQQIQINLPFLTPAEYEALEWNLLERQLQLRWEFPAIFQRSQHAQSPMQYEPSNTPHSPETQLLLSPTDQQPLPASSKASDNVNVPQPPAPEADGVSDLFSPMLAPVSHPMPHMLSQAKTILQSHIDSECWQILQGTVLAHRFISWDRGIPRSLEAALFPCVPENKLLGLQAATDPGLYQKTTPSQTSPGAITEHTDLSSSLSKGATEKQGMSSQHKYLAPLSGLPALHYLALPKAMGPAITSQSAIAEIMPEPVEITAEPLTEMISYEEQCTSPGPGFREDNETCAGGAQESLTEVQETMEVVLPESPTDADILKSLKTPILTKLNFHLRKKVLEIRLGIPIKARESRDQTVAVPENISTQEALGSLNNQGKTSLQGLPIPPDFPHAPYPELVCLRQQLIIELKAVLQSRKQARSRTVPRGSAHRVSKISQLSGDMTDAQVLCAQVEARVNSPSLEEAWCPESQGPGKSKDSAQVPTLAEKKEYPGEPKPAEDRGEGTAGFGLPSTRENRYPAEDQKPAGTSLNRTPEGPWRRSHSFDLAASSQQSPKHCPQLKLPELPPGAPGEQESEKNDVQDSQPNLNLLIEPARIPGTAQPVVPQASQGQPLLGPLIQGKPLQDRTLQNDIPQGPVRRAHTHNSPDLPESRLRNKKCFFHCVNPKTVDEASMFSPAVKVTKTRKKSLKKSLAPAKGPVPHAQSPMQYEPCDTAQSPEAMETSWPGMPVSALTRELLFFPDHARRLLEFSLQKQLIYYHWGLPQNIKQSIQLLLSPANQQPLPASSKALDNVNVPQPPAPEADGVSDLFSPMLAPVSRPMPRMLSQAKTILQSHIDSECWQILQGTVLAHRFISWDRGIPRSLEAALFPCVPENKLLGLQAATDPGLYQKTTPSQTSPGAITEHTDLSSSLSKGATEKQGMSSQHKYLAPLSGLPALHYLALPKAMGPAITSQSAIAEIMPEPVEITAEPLTEMISYEEQCTSPGPGFREDNETCAGGAQESLTEVQETMEVVLPESPTDADILKSLKTPILTKLNFHLRKKVLEIRLGIPIKARESRDQTVAVPENISTQEALGSLNNQGKTSLQGLPIPPDFPHAPYPELVCLRQQLIIELKAVLQSRKQARSRTVPRGSAHRVSKISQLSGDMTDAQVLCAQVEARVNSPSLEEAWCPESQGPGKSKDSAQVPTLAEKKEYPGEPKPAEDRGEGTAGFGLPSTRENRYPAEDQKPAGTSLNRTPEGPWRRSHSFDLAASSQQSPKHCPQLKLPELPPGAPGEQESEKNDVQDSQPNLNLLIEPARIPGTAQPVVPQASQGQPLLGPLIQGKPLQDRTLQNDIPQGPVRRAHTHNSPDLPESRLRNKKCFFHCVNPKTVDEASMFSPAVKVTKTRKKSLKKSLAPAKGPVPHAQSPMQYEPCDTAQSPEAMETSWPGMPVSALTRELLFFPDHARRLLEFSLQKQLIYYHWGLPQNIKQSIQLLLSPANQQPLPASSKALDNVNVPQPPAPEADGVSDLFSPMLAPVSRPMPRMLSQAKTILQSHIDSECWQILQGTVLAHRFISWDRGIPRSLEAALFPCVPENKLLGLQAATDPGLYQKTTPSQTSPGAITEHTDLSSSLSKGATEKQGMSSQHKYLAPLSGLPALHYLALPKAMGPAITSQSAIAEIMPEPVEITAEPLTEMISYEEQCTSPGPGFREDNETCAGGAQESLTEVQETMEVVLPESPTDADILKSLKTPILTKLNVHLRKKVLEIRLGIPIKARESRDQTVAVPENISTQEALGSLNNQGKTSLQGLPIPPDFPHAPYPELVCLRQQLIIELKAVLQSRKQARSRTVPRGSAHRVSKISQLSGDMTDAQVLCAQVEARVNSPSLEEAWCPESQGLGKSKDSAQVPTLAEKKEYPGEPKPAEDRGEGTAGFGLPSTRENRYPAEDQKPAGTSLNRTPEGPRRRSHSFDLAASSQQSLKHCPQLKLPELPPGAPGEQESEKNDVQDSQPNLNLLTEPARIPGTAQPVVPQASQGQPLLGPLIQGKPLQDRTLQNDIPQGPVRIAHSHKSRSLPESRFRNKMKCFFHCVNPKTVDEESMFSPVEKVTKTRKKSLKKSLAPPKGRWEQAKTEIITGDPKTQCLPSEKEVSHVLLDGPQAPDNQVRHHSSQVRSGSLVGHLHRFFGTVLERLVPPNQGTHSRFQSSHQRRRPSSLK